MPAIVVESPQTAPQQATEPIEAVSEAEAKAFIYQRESGNNPNAVNPMSGACGLAQALPCSKMQPCVTFNEWGEIKDLGTYECQDTWATNYMLGRYGSWVNAYNFWIQNLWW